MKFFSFILVFIFSFYTYGINDSIPPKTPTCSDTIELADFYSDLDSLLQLWYGNCGISLLVTQQINSHKLVNTMKKH